MREQAQRPLCSRVDVDTFQPLPANRAAQILEVVNKRSIRWALS
jgi:hypothetical protein